MLFHYSIGIRNSVLLPTDIYDSRRTGSCGLYAVIVTPNHDFRTSRPYHSTKVPTGLRLDRVDEAKIWHHHGILS